MPEKIDFVIECRHPESTEWTEHAVAPDFKTARAIVESQKPNSTLQWRVMGREWLEVTAQVIQGSAIESREKRKARMREWAKETYAERKAQGLCVRCGKPVSQGMPEEKPPADMKPTNGSSGRKRGRPPSPHVCEDCREKARKQAAARRAKDTEAGGAT